MDVIQQIAADGSLTDPQVRDIIATGSDKLDLKGRSVLVIIPDHTRTCPLPQAIRHLYDAVAPNARKFDLLIALGTHPAEPDAAIDDLLGVPHGQREQAFPGMAVFNHQWNDPASLTSLGTLKAAQVSELTAGRFAIDVEITINRLIFDYDVLLVVGPVFPHEVVGFSGGGKYFFPGISGPAFLNFMHWLGAVITNPRIIGNKDTPVRAVVEAACDLIPRPRLGLCMVVAGHDLAGMYFGPLHDAWSAAADLSDQRNIRYLDRPYQSVLSHAPLMYDELWVGAKCMYKLEPIVADGGELIIYGPHIKKISVTHERLIRQIGYHTLEYFLAQWDRFKDVPWGVLAHSTHVRGIGTYRDGVERPRIQVTLATGISPEVCKQVNLGYRDPATIDIRQWQNAAERAGSEQGAAHGAGEAAAQGAQNQSRLYVPRAGEVLYKLRNAPDWQRPQSK